MFTRNTGRLPWLQWMEWEGLRTTDKPPFSPPLSSIYSKKAFKADVKYLACTELSFIQKHPQSDLPGIVLCPWLSRKHSLIPSWAWWAPRKVGVAAPEERAGGMQALPGLLSQRYKLAM